MEHWCQEVQQLGAYIEHLDPIFWDLVEKEQTIGDGKMIQNRGKDRDMFGTEKPDYSGPDKPDDHDPKIQDKLGSNKPDHPGPISPAPDHLSPSTTTKIDHDHSETISSSEKPVLTTEKPVSSENGTLDSEFENSNQTSASTTATHLSEIAHNIWVRNSI